MSAERFFKYTLLVWNWTKIFSSTVNISFAKVAIATEFLSATSEVYSPMVSVATFSANTASVSVGIGKIQLCHYNLVWGESGYFRWHTIDINYIHLVLNSTLYTFVSRKGCPVVVEILSRPFSKACGVWPFIHAISEGCRGRNTMRPPRLAGSTPPSWASIGKWRPSLAFWECRVPCTLKNRYLFCCGSQNVLEYSSTGNEVNGRFILGYSWTIQCLKKLY